MPPWKKISVHTVMLIILVLLGIRIALPFVIQWYANKRLNQVEGYYGHIGDIDLHLITGSYEIESIVIRKTGADLKVPMFESDNINFSISWRQLFDGKFVADIDFKNPKLYYVIAKTKQQTQIPESKPFIKVIEELYPVRIDFLRIVNGTIHFQDLRNTPQVTIYLAEVNAVVENLTNKGNTLAKYHLTATAMRSGALEITGDLDPFARLPQFSIQTKLTGLQLPSMNDFFKAYAAFDVESGTLDIASELKSEKGKIDGYIKPVFKDMEVFSWKDDVRKKDDSVFRKLWEGVAGVVTEIFENQKKQQVATRIPIHGTITEPAPDIISLIAGTLKNAFIQAILPRFEKDFAK